jgi:hypothetical protein
MAGASVLAVMVSGARIAWARRAEPARDLLRALLTMVVVSGAGLTTLALGTQAADQFAASVIEASQEGDDLGDNLGFAVLVGRDISTILVLLLGLAALVTSLVQLALLLVRTGVLVVLAGVLPLSASFTTLRTGRVWFRRVVAWAPAFILYKPAAALLYATAFRLVSKLRRWLGTDDRGRPYLLVHSAASGYRLDVRVKTDWQTWRDLLPDGQGGARTADLAAALGLVRGRPFAGARARRYVWAEYPQQRMITEIVDTAVELAGRWLAAGQWRAAEEAAVVGLTVEPGVERLWRLRILATHASGNRAATEHAVERVLAVADDLGGDLEPETGQLLADLGAAGPRGLSLHAVS